MGMWTVEKAASSHSPPPDILCWYTVTPQKSGAVLAFTQHFGHEDFILRKILLNVLDKALTRLSNSLKFKFKIIFTSNEVTALSKSVKSGKLQKTYFLRRVITWSKIVRF